MTSIKQEYFSDTWDELMPLLQDHYHEVAMYQDKIDLNVDKEFYEKAQAAGRVFLLVARCDDEESASFGDIVGYSVTFFSHSPHYLDHNYAQNDVIFVAPEYRGPGGVAVELVEETEKLARNLGASVMTYHMKEYAPFDKLMEGTGFERMESLYTKYIGE